MDIFNLEKSDGERDLGLLFASRSFPILKLNATCAVKKILLGAHYFYQVFIDEYLKW